MITLQRHADNPIIKPNQDHPWEHDAAFNGCVVEVDGTYHMVYRALSSEQNHAGVWMRVSTIGYATSRDGIHFEQPRQLITPTEEWEKFGCEDPRITYFNGKYYIFYTALSQFPFTADGIKIGVAITRDFKTFEKHPVTTFNSKAMALFPELVDGKMAVMFTLNSDHPPAKIAFALLDREEDLYSPHFWNEWYENANEHLLHLLRDIRHQAEFGAPPVKTKDGWLLIYSYIENYYSDTEKKFGIEAVLLDEKNLHHIIGRTKVSLLNPEADYELHGDVPNIVFPTGAVIQKDTLLVYYGAADTTTALATIPLESLMKEIKPHENMEITQQYELRFHRFPENPIITPVIELDWQAAGTFNPAAIYEDGKVHILYRAQSQSGISTIGYATSTDGFHIHENLEQPIYVPRETFEKSETPGNSGCEDPRITKIDDTFFITYTAYDGKNPPRVALSTIAVSDFLKRNWNWSKPLLISPPGVDDKDACIVKGKKPNSYLAFHRLGDSIWLEEKKDLLFEKGTYLGGQVLAGPRKNHWDNAKLGIAAPPIETPEGWLLLYHGVSYPANIYKVGAMLLHAENPTTVIARTDYPLFGPETPYEIQGQIPNVVFPCGAAVINGIIFMYYGGADKVTGVATLNLQDLLNVLLNR